MDLGSHELEVPVGEHIECKKDRRQSDLTGAKVALAMVKHQWRPFGVPSVITSDQGSQFVGS